MRIASLGHAAFAATMIALGILGLARGDYVSLWQPLPQSVHAWAYVCAAVSLACGVGLLWRGSAAAASRVLFGYLLLWLLLVRVPGIVRESNVETWWAASQIAVMAAAAWLLYICLATNGNTRQPAVAAGNVARGIARRLYGLALIPFGLAHFLYPKDTAALVPGWLPWHLPWTYVTGGAFIVAGLAILAGVLSRLAAVLSAVQMGMFTLLVWAPVVAAGSKKASDWSEFVISATLTVGGGVVAESYRVRPRGGTPGRMEGPAHSGAAHASSNVR